MKKLFLFLLVTIFLFGAGHAQTRGSDFPMFYATPTLGPDPGLFKTTVGNPGGGIKLTPVDNTAWRCMEWLNDGSEDGVIYAITWTGGISSLGTVDQNTGEFNFIANTVDAQGLAVNPLTGIFYATVAVGWGYDFGTLDIETGAFTKISTMPLQFVMYTIAIDNDGICYAISGGTTELGEIDLTTGEYTTIGDFELNPFLNQNLSIDRETNELYWASKTNGNGNNFYRVDKSSGALTNLGQCAQDYQAFCIVGSGANPETPGQVNNLTVTPDASGALTATISWTNPSLNIGGETLTELTAVKVYENDATTPIYTNSTPAIGENDSYTTTVTIAGSYTYKVVAENQQGEGTPNEETAWIGEDMPAAPGNVQLEANNTVAQLVWTAPLEGLNGGYFSATGLVYDIYRMPANNLVSSNQTEVTFTETLTQSATHSYKVVAKNAMGTGGEAVSNAVTFCVTTSTFPWQEGFENNGTNFPVCWEQEYVTGTTNWTVVAATVGTPNNAVEGSYKASMSGGGAENGHITKLIIPQTDLSAVESPALKFWHTQRAWSSDQDKLRIYYKTSSNGNWNLLEEYLTDVPDWTERILELPNKSAEYYIAFEAQLSWGYGIQLDNISIIDFNDYIDAELMAITAPKAGYNENLSETEQVKVTVKNNGNDILTGFQLQLKLNETTIATEVYTGLIPGLEEAEYTFTATLDLSTEGENAVTVTVIATGDAVSENNSKTISVLNVVGGSTNFPLVEGFEELFFPPTGWTVYNVAGGNEAFWDIRYVFAHSGDACAIHEPASPMQEGWLISPEIRLPDNMESILEFWSYTNFSERNEHNGIWISTTDASVESFTLVKQLTGTDELSNAWKKIGVSLGDYAGNNVYLGFKYMGNSADQWFIDDISVKLAGIDGAVKGVAGAVAPMEGEPFAYKATIENLGNKLLTGYKVTLVNDENNNVLAVSEIGADIAPGATAHVNIIWTAPTTGSIFLRAVLDMPGDVNPTNDVSPVLEVNVQPNASNFFEGPIGTDNSVSPIVPVSFFSKSSRAQSLFFDHEIMGRSGKIIQIQYFSDFVNKIGYKPIQIWMANTTVSSLDAWLPESEFTLVFDGEVYFLHGKHTITIPLDIAYEYTGNNLVIMTNRPMDTEEYSYDELFYSTLTPDVTHRSRTYNSNTEEFNWTQPGTSANWHPNIALGIALEDLGSVSGTVTDGTTPLEGVKVEITGTNQSRMTDAEGNYNFNIALPGNHQIKATKFGYADLTSPVTVVSNNNTTADLVLTPLSTYTVSGKVTGKGAPGGLENVTLKLTGYSDYSAVTDAAGNYSIPNVYESFTYNIEAKLSGYEAYTSTVEVNANVTHNIELIEIFYPVLNPVAEEVGDVAVVHWGAPQEIVTFRYDNGICTGQLGFNGDEAPNGVLGACHRENAELHKMSWYLTDAAGEHTEVNLFVFELDAAGLPTTKLLFSKRNVPTSVSSWSEYVFPEPVLAPNGFLIALSHETSFLSLGTAAPDKDYPFLPGTNFATDDYTLEDFFTLESVGFQVNFMIRAEGYVFGKSAQFGYPNNSSSTLANHASVKPVFIPSEPVVTENPVSKSQSRSVTGYAVYRLIKGAPETSWTELANDITALNYTDNEWSTLPEETYQYAVKAVYSGGIMSEARLTNTLIKVGINENNLSNVLIYSYLNKIYIKNETNAVLKAVEILDIMGRVVYRSAVNDTETVISLQTATGTYVVRLISQDNVTVAKKVLIQGF